MKRPAWHRWARPLSRKAGLLVVAVLLLAGSHVWLKNRALQRGASVWDALEQHLILRQEAETWLTASIFGDKLVAAIIQVESGGRPYLVGAAGERGLMQIMPDAWNDMTRQLFGRPQPFEMAFDRTMNVEVGRRYLAFLQQFLYARREEWQSDERSLLLACYNGGPRRVAAAGFDLQQLPASVQEYVVRVTRVHDELLGADAPRFQEILATGLPPAEATR